MPCTTILVGKNASIDGSVMIARNDDTFLPITPQKFIMQAKFDGMDVSKAQQIVNACKEYNYIDMSPINKRAKGATVSAIVGATTGLAGTITSAIANTNNVRKDSESLQGKKTDADWQKEKKLNTASNVLAGTTTVASGVATVFNATQISAIKKIVKVADNCEEALK